MPEPSGSLSETFAEVSGAPAGEVQYGWCYTDWKDGKEIAAEHREHDYLNEEPYATQVRNILEQLGLPMPKPQEIFRGTHHDLLFLNSHGVVLRIGPTEVEDLMNPGFLQPLGWAETDLKVKNIIPDRFKGYASQKDTTISVAIYPGVELYESWAQSKDHPQRAGDLRGFLSKIGQGMFDVSDYNKGVVRVADDDGKEVSVEILMDAENEWNTSVEELTRKRDDSLRTLEKEFDNKADVMAQMMRDVFGETGDAGLLQRAFEVHQPLRRLFWEAFGSVKGPSDMPDPGQMGAFWDACKRVTNHPETAVMPCWHQDVNEEGKAVFVQEDVYVPHVVLYRQWTKEKADQVVQPINQTEALKAAVQRAHTRQVTSAAENRSTVQPQTPGF